MSQENLDMVLALTPSRDIEITRLFRDGTAWATVVEAMANAVHPDFECIGTVFGDGTAYRGIDGFRAFQLDWMAPWTSYRVEIEQTFDLGYSTHDARGVHDPGPAGDCAPEWRMDAQCGSKMLGSSSSPPSILASRSAPQSEGRKPTPLQPRL
jgi:hypothetical protein